eukprot:2941658-Pleurochrysis_carterae.AAC.1
MLVFVEYMRKRCLRQSKNAGKQLKAATIGAYESAMRTFRSRGAGRMVVEAGAAALMPLAMKQMRGEDGPPGSRKLSRAVVRAAHFAQLATNGFDRSLARGVVEWAAALLALPQPAP